MQSGRNKTSGKKGSNTYLRRFWIIYVLSMVLIVLFFAGIANNLFGPLPSFEELENPKTSLATEIYSSDKKLIGTYYIENRSNAEYIELPQHLVQALLATEDIRFEKHAGVDLKALFRVAFGVITGNSKGGGSTLTQQLAKNLFPRERDLSKPQLVMRKFKEWITAIRLERNYSKQEILAMYLNTVDFGSQSWGIKIASKTFFSKPVDSLNLQESALLIGVINAPTWYSPVRNPERSFERRNLVLRQMERYKFITKEVCDSVSNIPLDMTAFGLRGHSTGLATYFREILRMELKDWCSKHYKSDGTPYDLYKDGLKIYTTIDSRLQRYAEEAMTEHLKNDLQPSFFAHWRRHVNAPFVFEPDVAAVEIKNLLEQSMKRSDRYRQLKEEGVPLDSIRLIFNTPVKMRVFSWKGPVDTVMTPLDSIRYSKYFLQAGLMSMDPHSGYVLAYVGGIDYRYFQYDHVKLSKRQVGSTFKPFLYSLAMQEGEFTPCSKIANVQYTVDLPDGTVWAPKNTNKKRRGEEVTLKWALANSNNWISAYLIKRYSPQSVITMARKMGVTADLDPVPSLALGSSDISLYEMTGAFNTFANKGVHIKPIMIVRIEDKYGNVIESFVPEKQEAMSEETAYLMLELMKGVVQSGTGIRLRTKYNFTNPIAGKTGTTQNQSDGWFIGITPELTTGVWVGAEDRSVHFRTLGLGAGANTALPIWALYMKKAYADHSLRISQGDFERPSQPLSVSLDCDKYEKEQDNRLEDEIIEF
ncbi:MAG TPA: transglycosylase domain-containing protein [Bacteroidales bacterium]|nr:transglycosylase domain-containing protein [Bacteroidales bacterium]HPI85673.1 transglycosylase domain-containing protein [Bacteroidales bacterium]HPM91476.1 transglycosylase domain-containing protein [Bacteroidales bacterium]